MIRFLLALLLLTLALPAQATNYLIQYPGYTNATEIRYNSPQPNPGVDCQAGSFWAIWTIQNADLDPHHYIVNSNNTLTYSVPAPPVPQPYPTTAVTPIAGTSGTLSWSMPNQDPYCKKVVIILNGYVPPSALGTTITFPTPFTVAPAVSGNNTGLTISTLTTTQIKIPNAAATTGTIIIDGL